MASTTLAKQKPTISNQQKFYISIDTELEDGAGLSQASLQELVNNSHTNLDISSIFLKLLNSFNNARLGTTEISGGLVVDNIEIEELLFSSDGHIIDISDIRRDISNLQTSVSNLMM